MILEYIVTDKEFLKSLTVPYPMFATEGSAGIDLRANLGVQSIFILPGNTAQIHTGLKIWIRNPYYMGMIVPRSSLGNRNMTLRNTIGIIDSDYQGELILNIKNTGSTETLVIVNGERIAQLCIVAIDSPELTQVEEFSEVTRRGDGGFGSTGKL